MDHIVMSEMRFHGHVGVFPEEKENGQIFIVSCDMAFDKIPGAVTDKLEDTVDYAVVYDVIKQEVTTSRCDLIEHLAYEIAGKVLEVSDLIKNVEITVSKPEAPVNGNFKTMLTKITRERGE
ncbi:MAG: dihydroneopterin aldolase [Saccharofermentans sp.]|nr:dihydroneopterin aldolase [Saccharofermentans sp.]